MAAPGSKEGVEGLINGVKNLNLDKEDSDEVGAQSKPVSTERDKHNRGPDDGNDSWLPPRSGGAIVQFHDSGGQDFAEGGHGHLEDLLSKECLHLSINYFEDGKKVAKENVTSLNILFVQFIFMHYEEAIKKRLPGIESIQLHPNDQTLYVDVHCHGCNDIHWKLEKILLEFSKSLKCKRLKITAENKEKINALFRETEKKKKLSVFCSPSKEFVVVGITEDVDSFLNERKQANPGAGVAKRQIEIQDKEDFLLMQKLHFEEYVSEKENASVADSIEFHDSGGKFYVECYCTEEMRKNIEGDKQKFLSHIHFVKMSMDPDEIVLLQQRKTMVFIESELNKKKISGIWFIQNEKEVKAYAKSGTEVEKVVQIIRKSLFQNWTTVEKPEYFYFTTSSFKDLKNEEENETLKVERKHGSIYWKALKPTAQKMETAMEKYKDIKSLNCLPLTSVQIQAINWWQKDFKNLIQNDQNQIDLTKCAEETKMKLLRFLVDIHAEGKYIYKDARLLRKEQAMKYFEKKLNAGKINAIIDVESDNCISIIAINKNDTDMAERMLKDVICSGPVCYTDEFMDKIKADEFEKIEKWKGKYFFDGLDTDDGELFATDDIIADMLKVISTAGVSTLSEDVRSLHFSADKMEIFKKLHMKNVEDLRSKNNIEILIQDNKIHIKGEKSTAAKVSEKIQTIASHISKSTLLILDSRVEITSEMKKIAETSKCCVSKKILVPKLSNCWLLGMNQGSDKLVRVYHIVEHAETLQTDGLVCPCTNLLFPLKECFRIYEKVGMITGVSKHGLGKSIVNESKVLHCQKIIYLVTCEANGKHFEPKIKDWIHSVLLYADELKLKSIAIPLDLLPVSDMEMRKQALEIAKALKKPLQFESIEEIYLCECSDEPDDAVFNRLRRISWENEFFLDMRNIHQSVLTTPYSDIGNKMLKNIKIHIVHESLVSQKVEVLVNTTNRDLKLSAGMMSKTILKEGGNEIQTDLLGQHPHGINFGDIAVTDGGNLSCRFIFHTALCKWTQVGNFSLTLLKLIVWNCLQEAEKRNCKEISFPSLGTGNLGYPWRLVAETMFHTIHCYEQANKNTCITRVVFALHEKDKESIRAFQAAESKQHHLLQQKKAGLQEMLLKSMVNLYLSTESPRWKWGSLLRTRWECGGTNPTSTGLKEKFIWNSEEDCFSSRISSPQNGDNPLSELYTYRISTVELCLTKGNHEEEIGRFLKYLKLLPLHYVQHLFIVFPDSNSLHSYQEKKGKWRKRTEIPMPVAFTITGSTETVPEVLKKIQTEIEDEMKHLERKLSKGIPRRNTSDAQLWTFRYPDARYPDASPSGRFFSETDFFKEITDDIQIFESLSGTINPKLDLDLVKKTVQDFGCEIVKDKMNGCTVTATDINDLLKFNQKLMPFLHKTGKWEGNKATENKDSNESSVNVKSKTLPLVIEMSDSEFNSFNYFGAKEGLQAYKSVANNLNYKDGKLQVCVKDESTAKALRNHYETIKLKNTDAYSVPEDQIQRIPDFVKEVQNEFSEVCFFGGKSEITITGDDYTELQKMKNALKIKMEGKQKNRRNRRFQASDSEGKSEEQAGGYPSKPAEDSKRKRRFLSDDPESRSSQMNVTTNFGDTLQVQTKEGIIVKVYQGSILRLNVDCIVNAANENLSHGGGVALAISEAAGYDFDQESMDYIRKYGKLHVGQCCATGAGKLPYKSVIHTVGPRWYDYKQDEKGDCLNDLQQAVEVTFKKADELGMTSVALPAISSAIFGVPKDKCVEQYYQAVVSFSAWNKCKSLREIHFVDRDGDMVQNIKASLSRLDSGSSKQAGELSSGAADTTVPVQEKHKLSLSQKKSIYNPPLNEAEDCVMFSVTKSVSIYFHIGDILKSRSDAVVCPQDKKYCSVGSEAMALRVYVKDNKAFPLVPEKECRYGDVIALEIKNSDIPWKKILHTVTPNFDEYAADEDKKFHTNLKKTYDKIFDEAEKGKICSIAMPVLGIGAKKDFQRALELCAKSFANAVQTFVCDDAHYLKEVFVVFQSKSDKIAFTDAMKGIGYDEFEMLPNEENCCICMDTPTNPKRIACGHVFCTDCIDQQFTYKPACPSCGKVFGKMTGDQPPGTVFLRKEWRRLPGYEDCDGRIVITYDIRGGRQGEDHPNPHQYFKGITRSGFLPNNTKGRQVAKLLNIAFTRKLVFTIGRSRTTGEEGVVTWNDIHHKTRPEGGPQRFGYPDDTYLDRVLEELAVKGVTIESADDPAEYREYSKCIF